MKIPSLVGIVVLVVMIASGSAAQAGQATLSWNPPTTYTDGSPMTEIAGYKVHIGTTSCTYSQHVDVGKVTTYTAGNLTDGAAYYFAITAYDTSGAESRYSTEVYKILPPVVTHTITATAGAGGSIVAEGNSNVTTQSKNNATVMTVTVNDGANQLLTIANDLGYIVSDVAVDGASVGAVYSYTFTNVKTDHSLSATFTPANFTIVATAGTGGSITPAGSTTLPAGSNQAYTIAAATGYTIADVKVDGVSKGPVTTYSFSNLTANHTIDATFTPTGYTISATAGQGGSITPAGNVTLTPGSSQTYAITAATGYSIADVKVDGVSVGAVSSYTFSDVNASHTIEVSFSVISYTITASAGTGGSITPSGAATVTYGTNQTFAISAATGYGIADVRVDGAPVGPVASYTFDNVTANHTIEAAFSPTTYTISATAGTGGTITPSGSTSVSYGGNQTFTVAPSPGNRIADVKVDGASIGAVTSYTFSNVSANHTIDATFSAVTYTITASAATGGTIAPYGSTTVASGGSQTYTITPLAGYAIADIKVDGASVGAVPTYTFNTVTSNHSIDATFSAITYSITASAGTGGSVAPSGSTTVASGSSQTYTITPLAGYAIADVRVDGASVGAVPTYTFNTVTANHSIDATFSAITYSITASAGTGGSIAPSGSTTVASGSSQIYTITPLAGYAIADVRVDGASVGAVSTYTFNTVTANHSIDATFSAITYSITASAGTGGSIAPSGSTTVAYSGTQSYTITASAGFTIADVRVDGASVGAVSSYTFSNVTANHAIQASFSGLTYTITATAGTGGSITPSGSATVSYGGNQSYSIAAAAGYRIADVLVDGASVGAVSTYTFSNVTANHAIQASFSTGFTITASAGAGGTITPSGSVAVSSGTSQTFTIAPAPGYRILDVKVDGASVGAVSTYTFRKVNANHTIAASFNNITYTIAASAGTGGMITPAGSTTVAYGSSQSYTISAASGYRITDVRVDNASVGAVATYTFANVTANHTIQATFGATTFAVNCGGPVYNSPSGVTYVADTGFNGGSVSTTSAAISGTTDGVLYQSSRQGSSFSYRIPLANGSYSVTFKFAETQYTAAGKRTFNVAIGPTTVISNLDVYARAGANTAYDVTVPATVSNGAMTISFSKKSANATISAIAITTAGAAEGPATEKVLVADGISDPGLTATAISDAAFAVLWQRVTGWWRGDSAAKGASASKPSATTVPTTAVALAQNVQQPPKGAVTAAADAIYALPADRAVTWTGNAGVLGDIPERSTIWATVGPSNGDDTNAIQYAIDTCPADQVVALQSGTYTISRPVTVRSNVTLRGAGMGSTIIKGAAGMGGVYLVGFNASPSEGASIATAGLVKGSTTITTTSPHGWSTGDIVLIDQLNNPSGDPVVTNVGYAGTCFWCGRASGTRTLGQVNKVIDVPDATTATLEIPLYWNFVSSLSPQVTKYGNITTRAGVEDLTVDNSASASTTQANDGATLVMYGASNCWFLRVEAVGSYETMVRIKRGYRNTIRSCRFHEGTPALPSNGSSYDTSRAYGIWINPGSANLIENNQMYHLAMPMIMNSVASGNVVSYNYISDLFYVNMNWNVGAISFHGGHPYMNLIEGNYTEGRLQPDDVWGSSSHNTFFRNRDTLVPGKGGAKWDVDLAKNAQYYNLIGNILGARGFETVYMFNNVRLTSAAAIYRMGYVSDGDNDAPGNDPQVAATALLHGNWDSVNNGVIWNGADPQTLPASMYLTGPPSWWGEAPWPAIGPEVSPMYPAAPGICNGMPWDDSMIPSPVIPSAPASVTVQ